METIKESTVYFDEFVLDPARAPASKKRSNDQFKFKNPRFAACFNRKERGNPHQR